MALGMVSKEHGREIGQQNGNEKASPASEVTMYGLKKSVVNQEERKRITGGDTNGFVKSRSGHKNGAGHRRHDQQQEGKSEEWIKNGAVFISLSVEGKPRNEDRQGSYCADIPRDLTDGANSGVANEAHKPQRQESLVCRARKERDGTMRGDHRCGNSKHERSFDGDEEQSSDEEIDVPFNCEGRELSGGPECSIPRLAHEDVFHKEPDGVSSVQSEYRVNNHDKQQGWKVGGVDPREALNQVSRERVIEASGFGYQYMSDEKPGEHEEHQHSYVRGVIVESASDEEVQGVPDTNALSGTEPQKIQESGRVVVLGEHDFSIRLNNEAH